MAWYWKFLIAAAAYNFVAICLLALFAFRAPMDPDDSNTREDEKPQRRRTDRPE